MIMLIPFKKEEMYIKHWDYINKQGKTEENLNKLNNLKNDQLFYDEFTI
jgi:hypothetical protein